MALNVGLDASIDNTWDWKATEVNSAEAYVTNLETFR
jgi:hypothetical protein